MTKITQLTSTVASAMHVNSTDFYCVFNNSDYRLKPQDLSTVLGRREYAVVRRSDPFSLGTNSLQILPCNTIVYDSGGFTHTNCGGVVKAPRDMVVQLELGINWVNLGNFIARNDIRRNGVYPSNEQWELFQFYQQGSQTRTFLTKAIVVNSGDWFNVAVYQNDGAVRVVNAANLTIWSLFDA